jgi:formyl-CoA transferase
VFESKDGIPILISIQNDREWRVLATEVMDDPALAADPKFARLVDRVKHRAETDGKVAAHFVTMDVATLSKKLETADIAFARVNDVAGLIGHPHLRRIEVDTPHGPVSYPAPAPIRDEARRYGRIPALGEHTESVRKEFS